jgi:heme oxygenase
MTKQTSQGGTVEQNVSEELESLKSDIKQLSTEIRERISAAGDRTQQTWGNLDKERQLFFEKLEEAAQETKADLRHVGSDLKRRLTTLRQDLKSTGTEQQASSQSDKSA